MDTSPGLLSRLPLSAMEKDEIPLGSDWLKKKEANYTPYVRNLLQSYQLGN